MRHLGLGSRSRGSLRCSMARESHRKSMSRRREFENEETTLLEKKAKELEAEKEEIA